MKSHAIQCVDVDTAELWQTLDAYSNHDIPFNEFRAAVCRLYPGADNDRKWTMAKLEKLVADRKTLGILTQGDLCEYHRAFKATSTYLVSKKRLSEAEQLQAFTRGFRPPLWDRIIQRLQVKYPDHDPEDFYPINHILKSATFSNQQTSRCMAHRQKYKYTCLSSLLLPFLPNHQCPQ